MFFFKYLYIADWRLILTGMLLIALGVCLAVLHLTEKIRPNTLVSKKQKIAMCLVTVLWPLVIIAWIFFWDWVNSVENASSADIGPIRLTHTNPVINALLQIQNILGSLMELVVFPLTNAMARSLEYSPLGTFLIAIVHFGLIVLLPSVPFLWLIYFVIYKKVFVVKTKKAVNQRQVINYLLKLTFGFSFLTLLVLIACAFTWFGILNFCQQKIGILHEFNAHLKSQCVENSSDCPHTESELKAFNPRAYRELEYCTDVVYDFDSHTNIYTWLLIYDPTYIMVFRPEYYPTGYSLFTRNKAAVSEFVYQYPPDFAGPWNQLR